MNQEQAKRRMCALTGRLIQQYLDANQPTLDCDAGHLEQHLGSTLQYACPDCGREIDALVVLRNEMERRGGDN